MFYCFFFFFQAEDGIRDLTVTGVQTCALPIYTSHKSSVSGTRPLTKSTSLAKRMSFMSKEFEYRGENLKVRKGGDRKSTRLNSSHSQISYAVFCLKKKKTELRDPRTTITRFIA